jgi:hypothetical protein
VLGETVSEGLVLPPSELKLLQLDSAFLDRAAKTIEDTPLLPLSPLRNQAGIGIRRMQKKARTSTPVQRSPTASPVGERNENALPAQIRKQSGGLSRELAALCADASPSPFFSPAPAQTEKRDARISPETSRTRSTKRQKAGADGVSLQFEAQVQVITTLREQATERTSIIHHQEEEITKLEDKNMALEQSNNTLKSKVLQLESVDTREGIIEALFSDSEIEALEKKIDGKRAAKVGSRGSKRDFDEKSVVAHRQGIIFSHAVTKVADLLADGTAAKATDLFRLLFQKVAWRKMLKEHTMELLHEELDKERAPLFASLKNAKSMKVCEQASANPSFLPSFLPPSLFLLPSPSLSPLPSAYSSPLVLGGAWDEVDAALHAAPLAARCPRERAEPEAVQRVV